MPDIDFRPATPGDAKRLVEFVMMAGEGLPEMAWAEMADPWQKPRDVGLARAERDEGSFSYRNATMAQRLGRVLGGMIGYALPDDPVEIGPGFPAPFVPLQELENMATGTWYLNVLAVYPELRGQGLGGRLLERAEWIAKRQGRSGVSIIAFASNPGAVRLYLRMGFEEIARRRMAVPGWAHDGTDAILLVKPV
ncbi:GNAT family N-acetyltransferase [Psychromarinibacter sp. S121]|uniref:GNAT family N-acetyltransferase n=1 Tax=Psychromarinibacter sp. S121 TaxID=3415127 RepID=UPI003C7CF260